MPLISRMTEKTGRFTALLLAMVLDLVLAPFLLTTPAGVTGSRALTTLVLVVALAAVRASGATLVLFGVAVIGHVSESIWGGAALQMTAAFLRLVFLAYVFGLIIRSVLSERDVSYDTIAGAACAYVLLGLVWGEAFIVAELWQPGTFDIPASFVSGPDADMRGALIYFSYVTLTTVGYGDIHPGRPGLGALVITEAIMGQLFLAITVARLVGLHTSRPKE